KLEAENDRKMGFWSNLFNNAEKGFTFYQTYKTFKRGLEDLWTDIKNGDGKAWCRVNGLAVGALVGVCMTRSIGGCVTGATIGYAVGDIVAGHIFP
ncbi:unnamed protein product, partial [Mesorhabditis belari]